MNSTQKRNVPKHVLYVVFTWHLPVNFVSDINSFHSSCAFWVYSITFLSTKKVKKSTFKIQNEISANLRSFKLKKLYPRHLMPLAIRVRLPTNDGCGVGVLGIAHVASFGKVYWPEAPEGERRKNPPRFYRGGAFDLFSREIWACKFCKTKKYHMFLLAVSMNLGRFVMLFSVICYRFVSSYPFETLLNERLNQFGPFLSIFRVSMNYLILHGKQVSESTCMKLLSKSASWFTSLTILGLGIPACVARPEEKKQYA